MFSLMLTIVLAASLLTGNSGLLDQFNNKIEKIASKPAEADKQQEVEWAIDTTPFAVKTGDGTFLSDAKAYYSQDLANGQVLESKNEKARLPIASLTKLMTAYIILKDLPLNRVITVPNFEVRTDDSLMGVKPGEKLTVQDLLRGLLINSGGDAAQVLAVSDSGSRTAFVEKMNQTAKDLNLENTHFENPVGWDSSSNYSSAQDIAILSRILARNKFLQKTVRQKYLTVHTLSGRPITLSNTNLLLNNRDIVGIKTGYTPVAGECLVNLRVVGDHQVMTVIIGSGNRFGQTRTFLDWINSHFSW